MMWSPEEVAAYLFFGYLPRLPPDWEVLPGWGLERDDDLVTCDHDELVARGATVFASSFDDLPEGPHVVPLSGGLDSRAILAELCRRIHPDSITAITVGVPGNLDYELSVKVARAAGVTHRRIDLSQQRLTDGALVVAARDSASPTWVFDTYYNRLMRQEYGSDAVYWSGYLGSRLSSTKHLADDSAITFEEALDRFIELNRWSRTARLEPPDADLRGQLPGQPLPESDLLGHDERLDLWIRQQNLTRPVNLPAGYRHRAPFADPSMVAFMLSLSRANGQRQHVYRDILLRNYPEFFTLPTTANAGLSLSPHPSSKLPWYGRRAVRAVRRHVLADTADDWQSHYLDHAHALRRRSDYQNLARTRLENLVERDVTPWLSIERLWNEHQRRDVDHTLALTLLASLDIHLDVAVRTHG